ncbi:hypothetical protein F4780DRAFT_119049 [Xylariomycetidae sp. FL0641]|nr:hypothetical protein F4780DRAFT_119049 [Xylariomycetidae sp. FL0641]
MTSNGEKPSLKLDTNQNMPPPSAVGATPATETPRPILKLNTGGARRPSIGGDGVTPSEKRIKIKLSSQPGTPASATAASASSVKTKAGRTPKPSAKLTEAKKRGHDDSDEDQPMSILRREAARPPKLIKLRRSISIPPTPGAKTPTQSIRFRPKGEGIVRKPGDGYDSEASDQEKDPQRESTFILRVMTDEAAEYLKKALAENTFGVPKAHGGADFDVQFVDSKERRAMVTINGTSFAAVLVSLPTITETMKTWDRKSMMKNSDVHEMLLCFAVVESEQEAKMVPLPSMVAKSDLKWPHGITPPMHDAVNRRFRKTLTEKQWKTTQAQVNQLLEDDAKYEEVRHEVINEDETDADFDEDEDAEGEMEAEEDYFNLGAGNENEYADADGEMDIEEDDLEAALNEELAVQDQLNGATPDTQMEAPTPMAGEAETPAAVQEEEEGPVSEEDDEEDEEESDEDEDEDMNDEQRTKEQERKEHMSALQVLKAQYADFERQLRAANTPLIKKRLTNSLINLQKEMDVKKAALDITDDID